MTTKPIGVGFLGGGPVTQAIHLPTLATMPERFRVTRVMDVNRKVAEAVAARCGAASSATESEIFDDTAVEVVVVCSPNAFHAEQVIASCRAGKRLVLCEKPLAVTRVEAETIARVARETNTVIVVGTMHAYDPAYRAAHAVWAQAEEHASFVQSSIYLPTNDVFIDQATDPVELPPAPPRRPGDPSDPAFRMAMMRAAMLGLAIHDVPLVREHYSQVGQMGSAHFVAPFGYAISATHGDQAAELLALMPGEWPAQWRFRVLGRKHDLRVNFSPSYVLAGSSRPEIRSANESRVFESPINGYEAMWAHVGDVLERSAEPLFSLDDIVADLGFALDLADGADAILRSQA